MKLKNTVTCNMCLKKYFSQSLPFHQKTCYKVCSQQKEECIYCKALIFKIQYQEHITKCQRKNCNSLQLQYQKGDKVEHQKKKNINENQIESLIGLAHCKSCLRQFSIDRIAYHYNICIRSNKQKRHIFDSKKQRCLDNELQHLNQKKYKGNFFKQEITNKNKLINSNWRIQHQQLQNAMKANKNLQFLNNKQIEIYQSNESQQISNNNHQRQLCPLCHRSLNSEAYEKHFSICKTIKNKPAALKYNSKNLISGNIEAFRQKNQSTRNQDNFQRIQNNISHDFKGKIINSNASSVGNPLVTSLLQTIGPKK